MKKYKSVLIIAASLVVVVLLIFTLSGKLPWSTSKEYAVTFYSDKGTELKIDYVKKNSSATPPNSPAMSNGMIFRSWDTDFSHVTKDLDVHPICEEIKGKPNVIAVQSVYSRNDNTVVVPIQLCGDVCVSGLDITIKYNQEMLELQSVTEDKAVVFNDATPGVIRLNYVSTKNTIADVDVCNLQFLVNSAEGEIPITVELNGIYAFSDEENKDELYVPKSTILDGKVFVIN